jgi:hypothetical protein
MLAVEEMDDPRDKYFLRCDGEASASALSWAAREMVPRYLRATGMPERTEAMAAMAPVVDGDTEIAVRRVLRSAAEALACADWRKVDPTTRWAGILGMLASSTMSGATEVKTASLCASFRASNFVPEGAGRERLKAVEREVAESWEAWVSLSHRSLGGGTLPFFDDAPPRA